MAVFVVVWMLNACLAVLGGVDWVAIFLWCDLLLVLFVGWHLFFYFFLLFVDADLIVFVILLHNILINWGWIMIWLWFMWNLIWRILKVTRFFRNWLLLSSNRSIWKRAVQQQTPRAVAKGEMLGLCIDKIGLRWNLPDLTDQLLVVDAINRLILRRTQVWMVKAGTDRKRILLFAKARCNLTMLEHFATVLLVPSALLDRSLQIVEVVCFSLVDGRLRWVILVVNASMRKRANVGLHTSHTDFKSFEVAKVCVLRLDVLVMKTVLWLLQPLSEVFVRLNHLQLLTWLQRFQHSVFFRDFRKILLFRVEIALHLI
jgi:hypothetical protein